MAKSILIIEDDDLNMKLFCDVLRAQGFEVFESREGVPGFRMARLRRPDLIVMDIQLPAISGLEITGWLKDDPELKSIPVVAVTAFASRDDESRILAAGCEAYLAKPISVARFVDTVRRLVEASRPRAI